VIGYLCAGRLNDAFVAAFRAGFAETGYVEGRNVALEFRWMEGQLGLTFTKLEGRWSPFFRI
jgi:hypothetical protein